MNKKNRLKIQPEEPDESINHNHQHHHHHHHHHQQQQQQQQHKEHHHDGNATIHFGLKKSSDGNVERLPQEIDEEGNTEYKLKLVNPTADRFEKLVTQLKWRLGEGQGEAIYELGVEDNGYVRGLAPLDLEMSLATLERMAQAVNAKVSVVLRRKGEAGECLSLLVRESRSHDYIDVRVCVAGNVDSGKSTLIGVLIKGALDNGRGLMRSKVFNFRHELESGRTSSISHQILGFDVSGGCVNYSSSTQHHLTWGQIIDESAKVVTMYDLAGHERYLKTTVAGLTGQLPDYVLLCVGAERGVQIMTKEHLGIAMALKIPIVVVITKIDLAPPNVLKQNVEELKRLLKVRGHRKLTYRINTAEDVVNAAKNVHDDSIVPVFYLSSVTGKGVDLIRQFLNLVPPRIDWTKFAQRPADVVIDESFFVTGVGTVVGGTVLAGHVDVNMTMMLGPDSLGHFQPVQVKSIHSKRVPVESVVAGQSAGFALRKVKRAAVRKGMSLVHPSLNPQASWHFEADVIILYHSTTIQVGYQPVVQVLTVRQCARIMSIEKAEGTLRTGDKSLCAFQFMYRPEFLRVGVRIIFREGTTKGMGIIRKVFPGRPKEYENREKRHHIQSGATSVITNTPASSTSHVHRRRQKGLTSKKGG